MGCSTRKTKTLWLHVKYRDDSFCTSFCVSFFSCFSRHAFKRHRMFVHNFHTEDEEFTFAKQHLRQQLIICIL